MKALEAAIDKLPDMVDEEENVPAGTPDDTLVARRADALGALAESFIAHGLVELPGGDRHQIVVHMHSDHCEFDDGPAMATETARRLRCDASMVRLIEDTEGNPLDIGRKTRSIPPAMRRALKARDDGCRFPGCTQRRFVDGHHIRHWAGGGETKMDNLVLLCRHHHRLVHEGGFKVRRDAGGALRFWRPDGSVIVEAGDGAVIEHPRELTMLPRPRLMFWNGDRMDYDMALEALWQRNHVQHEPAAQINGPSFLLAVPGHV